MDKPQLWIIREKTEWPTNEFLTLFAEEGYETIDFDAKSISRAIEPDKPFGMISNVLLPYSLISVLSNAITYSVLDEICTRSLLGKLQFLKCIIFYDPPSFEFLSDYELEGVEILVHYSTAVIRGEVTSRKNFKVCGYADRPGFCNPNLPSYDKVTTRIAYSATLKLLRETLGPQFDLEKIWEEHCKYEFATRDVKATMDTMVPEPYVNHVPTLTGGTGYDEVSRFYQNHFVDSNPSDMILTPISRTVGTDRIVDEMIISFTHTSNIDWMLPGIPPTGKKVEIPLVAIVCIRGGKLYHEHIYWDQASVLVQIGLLEKGKLPIAGVETALKVKDEKSIPSNQLIPGWNHKL